MSTESKAFSATPADVVVPKIRQNLDTNLLKLIAVVSMFVDHFYKIFLPGNVVMAIIGRIAFPLFAYCIVVGCLYTKSRPKYVLRLTIFALVSQPFSVLAMYPGNGANIWEYILSPNIFLTLVAGVLVISGLMDFRKLWWMLPLAIAMEVFIGLDYGFYGIVMMVIFYLCRNKIWLSLLLSIAWMCTDMLGDFIHIGPLGLGTQFFALLALPLIYIHTNSGLRIPKYFFYVFYPAHFLVLYLLRFVLL